MKNGGGLGLQKKKILVPKQGAFCFCWDNTMSQTTHHSVAYSKWVWAGRIQVYFIHLLLLGPRLKEQAGLGADGETHDAS